MNKLNEEFENLIIEFGTNKTASDNLKKTAESQKNEIKRIMLADKLTTASAGGYKVTLSSYQDEKMDEDKLIEVLKNHDLARGIVKTQEYVDMNNLEQVLYYGNIDDEILLDIDSCRSSKTITKLTLSRVKKKEDK